MLDPPVQQPGRDGAGVETRGLCWDCWRAAAVLGINSTKITPWGKSRRKGAFCWLTDLPSVQAPSPQPRGGSGAAAACHSHVAALLAPNLGVLLPTSPPSSLSTSGLIPASHPSEPSPLPRASPRGAPSTLHPNLPAAVLPKKHFRPRFPRGSGGHGLLSRGGGWSPRVQELCSPVASLLPRVTGKAGDARSAPAGEQHTVGTARHGHPCPPPSLCPDTMSLFVLRVPSSLPPARTGSRPHRTHVNAIRSRHSWRTGGPSWTRLSRRPSLRGKKGQDPGQKGAAGPREMLGVRGGPGHSACCQCVLGVCLWRAGME